MPPSPKELKKLAKACREAGIRVYKGADFEISISEDSPEPKAKKSLQSSTADSPANQKFNTDALTEEQLLYWSTGCDLPFKEDQEESKS